MTSTTALAEVTTGARDRSRLRREPSADNQRTGIEQAEFPAGSSVVARAGLLYRLRTDDHKESPGRPGAPVWLGHEVTGLRRADGNPEAGDVRPGDRAMSA
ncbi:hypothetical protein [Nocardia flavorosea]|uniref:hypothetical protein n=1 Tax=Nocardia flavorosea TaxID=53429 RepID=UPI002456279E|nr:hypothetical protein [Nocardia flavorosea]